MEVGTWKEGASGMRAVCDVNPASGVGIIPVPGVGVVTGSDVNPSFVETCAHTLR